MIALPNHYFLFIAMLNNCLLFLAVPLGSSTLCLLLITVERYLSVVYPFHHQQKFTKARRYTLVIMSWVLAMLIMGVVPFALVKRNHKIVSMVSKPPHSQVIDIHLHNSVFLSKKRIIFIASSRPASGDKTIVCTQS